MISVHSYRCLNTVYFFEFRSISSFLLYCDIWFIAPLTHSEFFLVYSNKHLYFFINGILLLAGTSRGLDNPFFFQPACYSEWLGPKWTRFSAKVDTVLIWSNLPTPILMLLPEKQCESAPLFLIHKKNYSNNHCDSTNFSFSLNGALVTIYSELRNILHTSRTTNLDLFTTSTPAPSQEKRFSSLGSAHFTDVMLHDFCFIHTYPFSFQHGNL